MDFIRNMAQSSSIACIGGKWERLSCNLPNRERIGCLSQIRNRLRVKIQMEGSTNPSSSTVQPSKHWGAVAQTQHGTTEQFYLSGVIILGSFIAQEAKWVLLNAVHVLSKWLSTFWLSYSKRACFSPFDCNRALGCWLRWQHMLCSLRNKVS